MIGGCSIIGEENLGGKRPGRPRTAINGPLARCDLHGGQATGGIQTDVEAMISKDLSYLTEAYVPMKLKDKKQWLD
ncbi:MAG: hypothetical protein WBE26_13840 [Phycisphaerae bacterium]